MEKGKQWNAAFAIWQEKMDKGIPPHPSIERIVSGKVMLHPHLDLVWAAFWVLHNSRQIGFGQGPIALSEIRAFAALYDYDPGTRETEALVWGIQILDEEFLTIQSEKRQAEKKEQEDKRKPRGRDRTPS